MFFLSREQAKLFIQSFLQWMYTGIMHQGKSKEKDKMAKQTRDLNDAFAYLCKSYEDEIEKLKTEIEKLKSKR